MPGKDENSSTASLRSFEELVNEMIRSNIALEERRSIPIDEATKMGAISLFGEKYGDMVRVIKFGDSVELCGGIHAKASGQIGFFKIMKESSVAAGIRRIEAVTGSEAQKYIFGQLDMLAQISNTLEKHSNVVDAVKKIAMEHADLSKEITKVRKEALSESIKAAAKRIVEFGDINFIGEVIPMADAQLLKDAAFQMRSKIDNLFLVLGTVDNNKPLLVVMLSDNLVQEKGLNASNIIRDIAKEIQGGGGGQPFFATAGGKNKDGVQNAINKARKIAEDL